MKNLTITVEDSTLEWARIEAARRGTSLSRMVGDFMAELQQREDAYERAYLAWRTDERNWKAQTQTQTQTQTQAQAQAQAQTQTQVQAQTQTQTDVQARARSASPARVDAPKAAKPGGAA